MYNNYNAAAESCKNNRQIGPDNSLTFPYVCEMYINHKKIRDSNDLAISQVIRETIDEICDETKIVKRDYESTADYINATNGLRDYFNNGLLCESLGTDYVNNNFQLHDFIIILRAHLINIKSDKPSIKVRNNNNRIVYDGVIVGFLSGSFNYQFTNNERFGGYDLRKGVRGITNKEYRSLLYVELLCGGTCISKVGGFMIQTLQYIGYKLLQRQEIKTNLDTFNTSPQVFNGHGITLFSVHTLETLNFYKAMKFLPSDVKTSAIIPMIEDVKVPFTDDRNINFKNSLITLTGLYLLYCNLDRIAVATLESYKPTFVRDKTTFTYLYSFYDPSIRDPYHGKVVINKKLLQGLEKVDDKYAAYLLKQDNRSLGKKNKRNHKHSKRNGKHKSKTSKRNSKTSKSKK